MDKHDIEKAQAVIAEELARRDECSAKIQAILEEYGYVMEPSITLVVTGDGITRAGATIELKRPRFVLEKVEGRPC